MILTFTYLLLCICRLPAAANADGAVLEISPKRFIFHLFDSGPTLQTKQLDITNEGTDVMTWQATTDCNWLRATPVRGRISPGITKTANLIVDISGMSPGTYQGKVTISSDQASNSPQSATVSLYLSNVNEGLHVPLVYPTIQQAINAAEDGETVIVSMGTHSSLGDYGFGFFGKAITVRSLNPDDPNIVAATIIDGGGSTPPYYDRIHFSMDDTNSVLEGLTITNYNGPAITCEDYSSPTIRNCVITGNNSPSSGTIRCINSTATIIGCTISNNVCSGREGGGIYILEDPYSSPPPWEPVRSPTIINCKISGNQARDGGGIYCAFYARPTITNCTIANNTARWLHYGSGGGIYCEQECRPKVSNCTIIGNTAEDYGGGIYNEGNIRLLKNCIFSGNSAQNGGGIYHKSGTSATFSNCTFAANSADSSGGAIFSYHSNTPLLLTNAILWGNQAGGGLAHIHGGMPQTSYSCIQDDDPNDEDIPFGGAANGNIDDDPMFVSFPDDLHLLVDSACINAGSPYMAAGPNDVDIDGQARIIGARIDMGADEYGPGIAVIRPAGGEVRAAGSSQEIKWTAYGVDNVDIIFSGDGGQGYESIAENIDANDGSYMWQLPEKLDSNQCIVSVVPAVEDANVVVTDSGIFEIKRYPRRPDVPPGRPQRDRQRRSGLSENIGPELGCIKWKFETDWPVTASVALGHNNRVYVPCEDGRLYVLNNSGELIWSYDVNSPLIGSPAPGYYGVVYVGADDGRIYAIDNKGELLWTYQTEGFIYSSPVVSPDGKIYVCSTDGTIYSLATDGSELWQFKTADFGRLGSAVFATPAIGQDGTVYIAGLYDPNLYALDANDGRIKWACSFSRQALVNPRWPEFGYTQKSGWPFASPAIDQDGTIYQTLLFDPNLYAIDANSGTIIRSTNMKPQCDYVDDYLSYYGSYPSCGAIAAECSDWFGFEPNEWCRHIERTSCWSKPAIGPDGTIYVSFDDPYLRAVEPNGDIKWVTRLGTVGGFTLTVGVNGLIYAAGDDGTMYVVNPAGEEISRFQTDEWLSHPVITAGNTIIVSDYNDTLWAIGGDDCEGRTSSLHRPQDLNGDRAVNFQDYLKFAADWAVSAVPGADGSMYSAGDINRDGQVDFADMALLANRWLKQD